MNKYVKEENKIALVYRSKLTLEKAKEKYPEWYDRRIVKGDKSIKKWDYSKQKGHNGDELYNWWLRRIEAEAAVGGRYYCLMTLAIYALKCDIEQERLEADCFRLMKIFDERSTEETNRFTERDVLDALQAYEDDTLITYPVNSIANRSGLEIKKNKRNKRKRNVHLKIARSTQAILDPEAVWRNKGGRPAKAAQVVEWRKNNPDGTKYRCSKETGIDKKTVSKWWDSEETQGTEILEKIKALNEALILDEFDLDEDIFLIETTRKAIEDLEGEE